MFFRSTPKTARKGERTKILSTFSNSLSMTYRFKFQPVDAGEKLSGRVEIRGSSWLFPKAPRFQELEPITEVSKGMWDTLYSVYVLPDCDVTITREGSSIGKSTTIIVLVSLIITIALLLIIRNILL